MKHNMITEPATTATRKLAKPAVYFLILLLSYYLGYLSALIKNPSYDHPTTTKVNTPPQAADVDHYQFQTQCAKPIPPELVRQTILTRIFNGSSPYNGFPQPHIEPFLRQKRIKGWGSTGLVFKNLIQKVKPKTIIEVGTFLGASAIHMAELTSQLGLQTQILCLDDFRGWPGLPGQFRDIKMINGDTMLLYQFMQNVVHVNATENIIFLPFSTGSTLERLCEWGVLADLIEVDAGHDFHSAWSDINRAYKLLRPGGVIFGHDYFTVADNRGVRRAVNMFARVNGLRVKADGQHWVLDSF
ncbi:putative S-adenosyl-L-methionine-dependent methyltransferase [Helianthus anomalus]